MHASFKEPYPLRLPSSSHHPVCCCRLPSAPMLGVRSWSKISLRWSCRERHALSHGVRFMCLKVAICFFFQMTAWRSISNKMPACPKTCAEQASMKRLEKCMEALLDLPHYLIPSLSWDISASSSSPWNFKKIVNLLVLLLVQLSIRYPQTHDSEFCLVSGHLS